MDIFFMIAAGALAGISAGLLGIGGGIIIVPVLAMVFESQQVNIHVLMHVAIGTSLATIVVTSLSSVRAHHKRQAIDWSVVHVMAIGVFVGGLTGAILANFIQGKDLRLIFSFFLCLVAIQMYIGNNIKAHRKLPAKTGMLTAAGVIGMVSSLMGVGGGSMSVPFLTWCNVSIRKAVAISSAIGFPIAVSGTIGFIIIGWDVPDRPDMSIGFVNLPAFLSIVVASTLFAPVGAWLAHRVPVDILRRFFIVFLLMLGIRMVLS